MLEVGEKALIYKNQVAQDVNDGWIVHEIFKSVEVYYGTYFSERIKRPHIQLGKHEQYLFYMDRSMHLINCVDDYKGIARDSNPMYW